MSRARNGEPRGPRVAIACVAVLSLAPALAVVACTVPPSIEPVVTSRVEHAELFLSGVRKIDLLFVLDSSPRMEAHRPRLATALRWYANGLATIDGGLPSLHLGVITSDVGGVGCAGSGDDGRLRGAPPVDGDFLVHAPNRDGSSDRNYAGTLAEALGALTDVGTTGCAFVRPFEAIRRALAHPANAGFRRPEALLAIVIITVNDDSSPAPVADYVADLENYIEDPADLFIGAAAGSPLGSFCGELPASRLHQFLESFWNTAFTSVCNEVLEHLPHDRGWGNPWRRSIHCWDTRPLDLDPTTPELEPWCAGEWRIEATDPDEPTLEGLLAPCPAGEAAEPCYRIVPDDAWCTTGSGLLVGLDGFASPASEPIHATVECVVDWSGEQDPA